MGTGNGAQWIVGSAAQWVWIVVPNGCEPSVLSAEKSTGDCQKDSVTVFNSAMFKMEPAVPVHRHTPAFQPSEGRAVGSWSLCRLYRETLFPKSPIYNIQPQETIKKERDANIYIWCTLLLASQSRIQLEEGISSATVSP